MRGVRSLTLIWLVSLAAVGTEAVPLTELVRELDSAGVAVEDVALRRPTLDEVFLSLTGQAAGVNA